MGNLKIGAVFVPVTDINNSIEWYKNVLELTFVRKWPDNGGADFYFPEGEEYLTIVKVEKKQSMHFKAYNNRKICFFNLTSTNLEATHEKLKERGVEVTNIEDEGPIIGFEFHDPDGNTFGVIIDKD